MTQFEEVTGRLPAKLANAVSDAIAEAMKSGMEPDEAVSVAISVACNYAQVSYGDHFLPRLASLVLAHRGRALPATVEEA